MLIIEGSDNLGKTTLANEILIQANRLYKGLNFSYKHMSRPGEDFDFFHDYYRMIKSSKVTTVQDRFHLGGLVWHENKITAASLRVIEGWIRANYGLVVILYTDNHSGYRKMLEVDNREQMFGVHKMCQANIEYATMAQGNSLYKVQCDIAVPVEIKDGRPHYNTEEVAEKIVKEWRETLDLCFTSSWPK